MFSNITGSLKDAPQEERATWLDETKITAAARSWVQGCQSLRESASELLQQSNEKLNEFRGGPDGDNFMAEMGLLSRRKDWLQAVLEAEPATLAGLIQQQRLQQLSACAKDAGSAIASDAQTCTEDLQAVSRAPPCASWASLMTITQLQALGDFRDCRGAADIKTKTEGLKKEKGHLQNLIGAAKTALNDLSTAKKRMETLRKKAEEKAKKQEEKRKKTEDDKPRKKRPKSAPSKHPLVDPDIPTTDIPRLDLEKRESLTSEALMRPWVSRAPHLVTTQDARVEEFCRVFKHSSLRITDGHASRKLEEEGAKNFCTQAGKVLEHYFLVGPDSSMEPRPEESVAKVMTASFFAMVSQHLSLAKFEPALAPNLRYIVQGTMVASVWIARPLLFPADGSGEGAMMTNDFQGFASKATADDVAKAASDVYASTIGPGDMLYIPPGALLSIQALVCPKHAKL